MADLEYKKEEEDDEDEEIEAYKTVKDAVLFAIEISPSMLKKPPPSDDKKADRDSPASAALKCAYQLMQQRIISNPNDMMGILLFGTKESKFQLNGNGNGNGKSGLAYPHCYLLADLDVPAATDVKRLRDLVLDEEEYNKLLVPSDDQVSMANVLFCANQIFTTKAPNFSSRRLFLVTDNDNPHEKDKALRSSAAVRAKDLYDLGVIIELFPISQPGRGFERSKFYDDIVYHTGLGDPDAPATISAATKALSSGDGITLLQSLLSSINSRAAPKRALFSLPFEIGPGFKIGVKGYILIKEQKPTRQCYVWVGGEKPQIAVSSTTQIAEDTARTIDKVEIRKAYKFGGETIQFTPEEISKIRNFGDPIIRIIGFKPMSMLPIWANMRPSVFMYPSETDYIGSTRVFSALQQKMLKDEKMALAWYIPRRNATPVLAAIIPGEEKYNENAEQIYPPGMWIINLPFADDIRDKPETVLVRTTDELTDKMRVVIQQLQLPKAQYDPKKYPNPSLQWFYRILQAMALEEDLPEQPEDKTIPRYKQIDKRAGPYVIEWGEELEAEYRSWLAASRSAKSSRAGASAAQGRPTSSTTLAKRSNASVGADDNDGDGGVPAKRARTRTSADPEGVTDDVMKKAFVNDGLGKFTLAVLKEWAERKHIPIHGRKADVVERIQAYFESK